MAWPAELVEHAVAQGASNRAKWQAIQDELPRLPSDALRELMVDFWRAVSAFDAGDAPETALDDVIQAWYEKALFARRYADSPERRIESVPEWESLPDTRLV
jgi:hypothetical protein